MDTLQFEVFSKEFEVINKLIHKEMNSINTKNATNGHSTSILADKESAKKKFHESSIQVSSMAESYRSILQNVGEDVSREGLLKTPERAAKAMQFFTKGYGESLTGK